MLFELSDDLLTDLTNEEVLCLELILQARRRGYHLLMGSDEVFSSLIRVVGLSSSARAILRKARRRQVEKEGFLNAIAHRIRISHSVGPVVEQIDHTEVITLPLSHYQHFSAADQSVVLGENASDACLVAEMARYYAASQDMRSVKLRFRPDSGGGTTTADAFRRYREDPRICICVVDSDCLAPEADKGTTATALLAEVNPGSPWATAICTSCREAENTLSARIVAIALEENDQLLRLVPQLERLGDNTVPVSIRNYCDFKKGTSLKSIWSINDDAIRRFWVKAVPSLKGLPGVRRDCAESLRCLDPDRCNCWIVKGFGRTLLRCSLRAVRGMSPEEIESALCDATRPHWTHIGRTVFSWVCGTEETRV